MCYFNHSLKLEYPTYGFISGDLKKNRGKIAYLLKKFSISKERKDDDDNDS